jgi:hypothetical protein
MAYKTNLVNADVDFASMMEGGFGIVTVMNAKVYEAMPEVYLNQTAYGVINYLKGQNAICELDTLKIANVTQEGPTKTITGGKYSNALLKFGKSARLEMQDALGSAKAIEHLCGGIREWTGGLTNYVDGLSGLHFGEDFQGPKTIVGESFFIDRATGKQVDVNIIFYQFLPDSLFNLTQDAEGDATVFDMNGDLLTTEILLGTDKELETHGVFYSILPADQTTPTPPSEKKKHKITIQLINQNTKATITDSANFSPNEWSSGVCEFDEGASVLLPTVTLSGYEFKGYYQDSNLDNPCGTVSATGPLTIYAAMAPTAYSKGELDNPDNTQDIGEDRDGDFTSKTGGFDYDGMTEDPYVISGSTRDSALSNTPELTNSFANVDTTSSDQYVIA